MPRDRQTRRALVVSMAFVLFSVSTGCLRPSIVRPSIEPISESSLPVSAVPVPHPAPAPTPTSNPATLVPPPLPTTPPNPTVPTEPSTPAARAAAPTPLLDAALERVEAMNHLDDDPIEVDATPAQPTDPNPMAITSHSTPAVSKVSTDPASIPIAATTSSTETPKSTEPPSPKDISGPQPESPIPPDEKKAEAPAVKPPSVEDVPAAIPPLEELTSFGVSELHLCRKVHGFGSFEPLNQTGLKSGQRLVLYCEVTGLEYESKDQGFLSRLSSRIEIKTADSGLLQWELDLGSKDDLFGRRRRDYYVNYLIELPKSLIPGNYRLKLTLSDQIANRTTSAEIPLEIVP